MLRFLLVMYLYRCIPPNIYMILYLGDVMLDGTMNVSAWAVIAFGGVTGDVDNEWVAARTNMSWALTDGMEAV